MSVSDEIIKVIDALAEKVGVAIDWTSQNVIPYLEQLCGKYINYEIATSVVWMVLATLFGVIGYVVLHKNKEWGVYRYETIKGDYFLRVILYLIMVGIPIVVIVTQTFDIVTCLTFPEKIILEELQSIYSNMK